MSAKKSSQRLQVVLQLAHIKQQQAAERLAQATRALESSRQQTEQLISYQVEYNEQFTAKQGQALDAAQLRNYLRFYKDLDGAVISQQQRNEISDQNLDFHRKHWQKAYGREKNLESLIAEKKIIEAKQQDDKEQRALDDRSQQKRYDQS